MKVRTITLGASFHFNDFNDLSLLSNKFDQIKTILYSIKTELENEKYEVQTIRISMNSFEDWLLCSENPQCNNVSIPWEGIIDTLRGELERIGVTFCSLGGCSSPWAIKLLPQLLHHCEYLHSSVRLLPYQSNLNSTALVTNYQLALLAAESSIQLFKKVGDFGNFRFCASFNCPPNIPFFPVSYHHSDNSRSHVVSIGLENGDLLFLGFASANNDLAAAQQNLSEVFKQVYLPVQSLVQAACADLNAKSSSSSSSSSSSEPLVVYGGLDASINPGLSLPDSVGLGMEHGLQFAGCPDPSDKLRWKRFGSFGTLAAVSTITAAVKSLLADSRFKMVGYNGLMLPVMEDLVLAQRASEDPPTYSLRDLLFFSSCCGVGLDTVPVSADVTPSQLADIYMETAALAFRLNKPLSCRLLPMTGKAAGDLTDIPSNPYLCNTKVFHI